MLANKKNKIESLTLKVTEVAQLLGVCKRTIYRLRDEGKIPKEIKIGNSSRWRHSDIVLFVETGSMQAFRKAKRLGKKQSV